MAATQPQVEGVPQGLEGRPVDQIDGVPQGLTGVPVDAAKSPAADKVPNPEDDTITGNLKSFAGKVVDAGMKPLLGPGRAEREAAEVADAPPAKSDMEHPYMTAAKKGVAGMYRDANGMLRQMVTSPVGIATLGAGEIAEAPGALGRISSTVSKAAAPLFTASGLKSLYEGGKDIVEHGWNPENVESTLGGAGTAALGGAAMKSSLTGPRSGDPRLGGPAYTEPSVGRPDATPVEPRVVPEREITPAEVQQSAAAKGITQVAPQAPANSRMNRLDVVSNAMPKPIVPSRGETLEMPGGTIRPGTQLSLPPAPQELGGGIKLPEPTPAPAPAPVAEPGDLKTLKAVGGKVVDTDPQGLKKQLEAGLKDNTAPKPAAESKAEPAGVPEGVTLEPEAKAANPDEIAKVAEPGKILDRERATRAHADEDLEKATKGRADEMAEKHPVKTVGLTKEPFAPPAKKAVPETVGTAKGAVEDTDHFQAAKKELGEKASISDVAKRAQEMKDEASAPKAEPLDHAAIAKAHNDNQGFTYNPKEGFVRDKPVFSVAGEYPDVEMVTKGNKIKEADVKAFAEQPDVKAALAADPRNSIGGWNYKGNAHLEISKLFHDQAEAIAEGKRLNQDSIYDHANRTGISTGGTAADEAAAKAGVAPTEEPKAEETKTEEPKLAEDAQRGLEHRIGAAAAADKSPEGIDRAQRLVKGTNAQYADLANTQGPEKPGGGQWEASDFSKAGTGSKTLPANKQMVIDHIVNNIPHDEFMSATDKWGPNANAAKSVGAAAGSAPAPDVAGIPEETNKYMTAKETAGVTKTPAATQKFLDTMEKIPEVQEYTDIALQGEGARKWYQRSSSAFDSMAKESPDYFKEGDKDKFLGMLAGSSPRQSVAMNMREALAGWKTWVDAGKPELSVPKWKEYIKAGRPEGAEWKTEKMLDDSFTIPEAKVPNIIKSMNGEETWPDLTKNKNFKAPSFEKNLKGWLSHVTSDGWMALFAGLDASKISDASLYHPMSVATRAAAEALGWEPAEAQAAIWSFTQSLVERGEQDPSVVRSYSEDYADIMAHDPQTRGLLEDLGVQLDKLDGHLKAIGEKPEVTGRTTGTTSRSIGKLKGRVEEARGKGVIPPPKSAQGEMFKEEHPTRADTKDKGTSFNPNELEETEEPVKADEAKPKQEYKYNPNASETNQQHIVTTRGATGRKIGELTAQDTAPGEVTERFHSIYDKTDRGKGYGKAQVQKLFDESFKNGTHTVKSDISTTPADQYVWESLEKANPDAITHKTYADGRKQWSADLKKLHPSSKMKALGENNPLGKIT